MVYDCEKRRQYRANEIKKYGLYKLNRHQALRRAIHAGRVTDDMMARYEFTVEDLPFLNEEPVPPKQALTRDETRFRDARRKQLKRSLSVGAISDEMQAKYKFTAMELPFLATVDCNDKY